MKTITLFLLLAACQLCFAGGDTNTIAVSDWSKPVGTSLGQTLRGRMILAQGHSSAHAGPWPETEFYLELQNVSGGIGAPMQIHFDPAGLYCEMVDSNGKPPPMVGGGGSGGGAGACSITLPYDGTIRLRVGMYGYGLKPGDGLLLVLIPGSQWWDIRPGNTNDYFMSGTFTVAPPTNSVTRDFETERAIWSGTLEFPKMKVWVGKP
jgi:hypothetical protein